MTGLYKVVPPPIWVSAITYVSITDYLSSMENDQHNEVEMETSDVSTITSLAAFDAIDHDQISVRSPDFPIKTVMNYSRQCMHASCDFATYATEPEYLAQKGPRHSKALTKPLTSWKATVYASPSKGWQSMTIYPNPDHQAELTTVCGAGERMSYKC